jgi:hypothetical protein
MCSIAKSVGEESYDSNRRPSEKWTNDDRAVQLRHMVAVMQKLFGELASMTVVRVGNQHVHQFVADVERVITADAAALEGLRPELEMRYPHPGRPAESGK